MMQQNELDKAIEIARKYEAGELYLIGSALYSEAEEANDYDFAVNGLPKGYFFKFYGELLRSLNKNVDLIDLSGKMTKFKEIVLREGKLVYAKSTA